MKHMATQNLIAAEFGRHKLRAVLGDLDRERLRVRKVVVEPVPADVDPSDAAALGKWAGSYLAAAGFPRGRATIVVSREHVVLKRMTLPSVDADELPQMTGLALKRDLPFDAETAVIDFVPVDRSATSTTVLAAAVPAPVLAFARDVAKEAGYGVDRLSLRAMGCASLLALSTGDGSGQGVLAVDMVAERVEFCVIVGGGIRFSRAGELQPAGGTGDLAEAAVTEARRTWMSYRIVDDSDDVHRAIVLGEASASSRVAGAIGEILRVETRALRDHPRIDDRGQAGRMGEVWPLAGLLLGPGPAGESIDFARPRRAPDFASRRRRMVLAGVGALVVLVLGALTAARLSLAGLREQVAVLEAKRNATLPLYVRFGRDRYKLTHLQLWESAGAGWLEHLEYVAGLAPPRDRLVLDEWAATLEFAGVAFDRKTKRFTAPAQVKIVLEGEAADRATADAFRGLLVDTDTYLLSTSGPETRSGRRLSYAFQYNLRTDRAPPAAADSTP